MAADGGGWRNAVRCDVGVADRGLLRRDGRFAMHNMGHNSLENVGHNSLDNVVHIMQRIMRSNPR